MFNIYILSITNPNDIITEIENNSIWLFPVLLNKYRMCYSDFFFINFLNQTNRLP